MNELKFELSVLFTKTKLSPYTGKDLLRDGYFKMFGKEVNDEELDKVIGDIINDQYEMYNRYIQEIPDDYELKND